MFGDRFKGMEKGACMQEFMIRHKGAAMAVSFLINLVAIPLGVVNVLVCSALFAIFVFKPIANLMNNLGFIFIEYAMGVVVILFWSASMYFILVYSVLKIAELALYITGRESLLGDINLKVAHWLFRYDREKVQRMIHSTRSSK